MRMPVPPPCVMQCQSRAEDLLRVSFEEHPGLQYCLLLLPNSVAQTPLSRCMNLVPLLPGASLDQSLYLLHRYVCPCLA